LLALGNAYSPLACPQNIHYHHKTQEAHVMSRENQLLDRINENLESYYKHVKAFKKKQIIEMAEQIAEMTDVHAYLLPPLSNAPKPPVQSALE
jgi:hypothetical protein